MATKPENSQAIWSTKFFFSITFYGLLDTVQDNFFLAEKMNKAISLQFSVF